MEMMHMHTGNCAVISRQETPECSLMELKLTRDNCSPASPSQDNSNLLSPRMDWRGDSNWQMSDTRASSNLEDCLRHPPEYPNRR